MPVSILINRQEGLTKLQGNYGFQFLTEYTFLNQEHTKLNNRRYIFLTFVVQQLLLLDDLSLEDFFSYNPALVMYVEAQESPDIVMTYNYPSLLVCTTLR